MRWFSQVLEDIKDKRKRWQEIEKERLDEGLSEERRGLRLSFVVVSNFPQVSLNISLASTISFS